MKNTIDQFGATKSQKTPKKNFFVPITYYGYETLLMSNKIKSMIERVYPTTNVIFGYKKGTSLSKFLSTKHKGTDPMNIGVIYKLECLNCAKVYIGQSQFDVKHRMNQHNITRAHYIQVKSEGENIAVQCLRNT